MELGIIQKTWIQSLKDHPERQEKGILGYKSKNGNYFACCLGELHIIGCQMRNLPPPFNSEGILKDDNTFITLKDSYKEYGLKDERGSFDSIVTIHGKHYLSLAAMNDGDMTWPEIAKFIEENPEKIFTHSA